MKPKYLFYALAATVTGVLVAAADTNTCTENYKFDTTILADNGYVATELAVQPGKREMGLSGRRCIGEQQGMLFVFGKTDYHSFWMKDMKFAIDIVWLTKDQVVSDLKENVRPSSYPASFSGLVPGKYVLELPAGRAAELAIEPGKTLKF